ncbi:hypothetical protein BKA70DRAFT_1223573 [Coprinopsis sp. MPI-PUGE-AT-0042]|nr:hypothetical protein BKA70DRAFT_1223573 [Coprinopsis sp. MPI-PUGE-AT-0042]
MACLAQCEECGKSFANETGLFTHQRKHCKKAKRGMREALSDARAYWKDLVYKRRRTTSPLRDSPESSLPQPSHEPRVSTPLTTEDVEMVPMDCTVTVEGIASSTTGDANALIESGRVLRSHSLRLAAQATHPPPGFENTSLHEPTCPLRGNQTSLEAPDIIPADEATASNNIANALDVSTREYWEVPSSGSGLYRIFFDRPPPVHDPDREACTEGDRRG